jgi:hypothetical protein
MAFIEDQNALQRHLTEALRTGAVTAPTTTPELINRNSDLIWTWDYMSLALCLDWAPCVAKAVPTADEPVDIAIERRDGTLVLDPWPFTDPHAVTLRCEGRRLKGRYRSQSELAAALTSAAWETVEFALTPSED